MGMNVGGRGGLSHEINMTPLIDVVLVLLIIMMVILPMTRGEHQVALPPASDSSEVVRPLPVLCVEPDGVILLDGEAVPLDALTSTMEAGRDSWPDRRVLFQCDAAISYQEAVVVLDAVRAAGCDIAVASGARERREAVSPPS